VIARDAAPFTAANACGLAVMGACLLWLSRDGGLDFSVARAFAEAGNGGFPLRNEALLARGGHIGLRWLALSIWLSAVALAVASGPVAALRPWRSSLIFFSVAAIVSAAAVTALKTLSAHSCPWDLDVFGGTAHWFPLLGRPDAAAGPGHCWPGGHASGGFALLAGYFALRDSHRAFARVVLALALALGLLMSFVQIARGAHFLTHNLWSLWIAWLASFAGYLAWRRITAWSILRSAR
jgi:membrane-associated PAP2 superfamily phosphatase